MSSDDEIKEIMFEVLMSKEKTEMLLKDIEASLNDRPGLIPAYQYFIEYYNRVYC